MKVVLLCGNAPNQKALANKVARQFDLAGIVIEQKQSASKWTFNKVKGKVADRISHRPLLGAWKNLMAHYQQQFPGFPSAEQKTVELINNPEVVEFVQQLQPDLIMVSGTGLIKSELLNLSLPIGIVNLHTGLSPYVKGGPNCTNWCLANNEFHLIGNTIMWLDSGIDSGNIITTEFTNFTGNESLSAIHLKVMEHAHELYLNALTCLKNSPENCPNVPQDELGKGQLYLTKMWTGKVKSKAVNAVQSGAFKAFIQSGEMEQKRETVRVIPLPD